MTLSTASTPSPDRDADDVALRAIVLYKLIKSGVESWPSTRGAGGPSGWF